MIRRCSQCEGKLVLIGERVEKPEGARTPITTREYRCLDENCQGRIDKDLAARLKTFEDKKRKV